MDQVDSVSIAFLGNLRSIKANIITAVSSFYNNMTGVLLYGIPFYVSLLLTMTWRSIARVDSLENLPKILGGFGGFFFAISDSLIAFDMFYTPIKYSNFLIISTYYIAQLGITLTILDHGVVTSHEKKLKKSY